MSVALAALLASLAVLAYTYAGYPLAMALLARLAPRPVRRARFEPPVAIVIASFNGAAWIGRKLESCLAQDYPAGRLRVVVACDGPDDATRELVQSLGDPRVRLIEFPVRRGKAACVNDAVAACGEDFVVLTDVRQVLDRLAVRRLLENLADPRVGAVSGALTHGSGGESGGLDAYWRYEQALRGWESAVHSMVGVAGALYAIRRECFRPIPPQTILDDVLIPMQVVLQGRRVVFEAGAHAFDEPMHDLARERARKVRTLAGNFQLVAARPDLLAPWRNPVAAQFASHKFLRLLGPVALAVALAANLALAGQGPALAALLALQCACYGAAALGAAWPAARRARAVRLALAFVTLNAFVVLGFIAFATNRSTHLWSSPAAAGRPRA